MGDDMKNAALFDALLLAFHFLSIAAIGFCITLRLLRMPKKQNFLMVIPIFDETSGTEILYAQHLRLLHLGEGHRGKVVALDMGLSEQNHKCIDLFCRSTEGLYLTTPSELPTLLSTITKDS